MPIGCVVAHKERGRSVTDHDPKNLVHAQETRLDTEKENADDVAAIESKITLSNSGTPTERGKKPRGLLGERDVLVVGEVAHRSHI
jgi:hypothetical protein